MNTDLGEYLCSGRLLWEQEERETLRYGFIVIDGTCKRPKVMQLIGKIGSLIAVVETTAISPHIGDNLLGFTPTTPDVGEMIVVGENGELIFSDKQLTFKFGLRPLDGRERMWLNVQNLYRLHYQIVKLYFKPKG